MSDLVVKLPDVTTQVTIKSAWMIERDRLIQEASAFAAVKSQSDYERGMALYQHMTKASNALERTRKDLSDPFNRAAKLIKSASDQARSPLENARDTLNKRLTAYFLEQKRLEAEAKRKLEEEQRAAIEKQQAEHAAAVNAGMEEPDAEFVPKVQAPAAPIVQRPHSTAGRPVSRLVWEIVDPSKVPDEFKSIDPVKINAWQKLNEERITQAIQGQPAGEVVYVPGIKFKIETKMVGNR